MEYQTCAKQEDEIKAISPNETRACHTVGLQEHCGKNLVFQEVPDNSLGGEYGGCDCSNLRRMWYDPQNDSCFVPHTQGWCSDGEWLTMKSEAGPAFCERTPCPVDGEHVHWNGRCYRRGERGPCDEYWSHEVFLSPGNLTCVGLDRFLAISTLVPKRQYLWLRCQKTVSKLPTNHNAEVVCGESYLYYHPKTSSLCGSGTYSPILKRCVGKRKSDETL